MLDIKLVKLKSEQDIISAWENKNKTVVSIICITYNHGLYIEDAIKSFLMQKTNFSFEVIIHDDASSDTTINIIKRYHSLYPNIIKPIFQTENQYSKIGLKFFWDISKFVKGKYIALCEGDDYWIDSSKIQKQTTALMKNKNISLVHTNSIDFDVTKNEKNTSKIPSEINTTMSLMHRNRIRTLTTMFRASHYLDFTSKNEIEVKKWLLGDWPLWIYLSTMGDILLLNDTTAIYRVLGESLSHSRDINKLNAFRRSTFEMRLSLIDSLCLPKKATKIVSNASIKDQIRFDIELIDQAYKNCSLKYKFKYIRKRISFLK